MSEEQQKLEAEYKVLKDAIEHAELYGSPAYTLKRLLRDVVVKIARLGT